MQEPLIFGEENLRNNIWYFFYKQILFDSKEYNGYSNPIQI